MAAALPLLKGVIEELGPVLVRAGAALLGGAAVAGTASLSSDTTKDESKAKADAKAVPRTGEKCKKCPPEETGFAENKNHHMSARSRKYQGRITGRPYSVEEGWSEEWEWLGTDFDGFVPAECLLQEAKAHYAQFLRRNDEGELKAKKWFEGYETLFSTLEKQAKKVKLNPPSRLKWYFEEAELREYMLPALIENQVASVWQP
ncbi:restriction endonuclease fold toxin 5 domain-containing protein [Burkholderia ubonensis]|uniref:restriction endonuclease fold toxin 5 domain-containing protein n=1 Tax=Burkholderia ubonensis TaxID=101571 RepID=UPI0009B47818|nr:restriction endonuclease fold toxin 5 domain-containing protein [Burkholderia ubonensis]